MDTRIDVEALTRTIADARLRTRRIEVATDDGRCWTVMAVAREGGADVHWMRWVAGDLTSREGGTTAVTVPPSEVTLSHVSSLPADVVDPLGNVLPHHASATVTALLPTSADGRTPDHSLARATAVSLCPTHGLLRDALGGDTCELVASHGVVAGNVALWGDGTSARNRRDAARRQPSFARILSGRWPRALVDALNDGGDHEAHMGEAILDAHPQPEGVPAPSRAALERMRGIDLTDGLDGAVFAMGVLPPEWLPTDATGWRALSAIASGYKRSNLPASHARRILAGCRLRWGPALTTLSDRRHSDWNAALARSGDLVQAARSTLVAPVLAAVGDVGETTITDVAVMLTLGGHGLREIVDVGRHFVRGRLEIPSTIPAGDDASLRGAVLDWHHLLDARWRRLTVDGLRTLAEPDSVGIDVTTADGRDGDEVVRRLRLAGMRVLSVQHGVRLVQGTVRRESLEDLFGIDGVEDVRTRSREADVGVSRLNP